MTVGKQRRARTEAPWDIDWAGSHYQPKWQLPYCAVQTSGEFYENSRVYRCLVSAAISGPLLNNNSSFLGGACLTRDTHIPLLRILPRIVSYRDGSDALEFNSE